jgi:hypothetical protein
LNFFHFNYNFGCISISDIEQALCVNAGELLDQKIAFQLALGNLDPFTLKKMDDWHPDTHVTV